jgi:acyl-CoA synthetase (AMP-forming)/AMP-acid ligase II
VRASVAVCLPKNKNSPKFDRPGTKPGPSRSPKFPVTNAVPDGNLYLVDRLKDMIVSGGENVYSAEVERALAARPAVAKVAVVGAPDEKWGERVVAFVVQRPDASLPAADLVSHCRRHIAGYKVPKEIHFLSELPSTASGKVQKAVLRQQLLKAARVTG